MRTLSFLILLTACTIPSMAQDQYLLYSYKGNVTVVEKTVESKAKAGKPLDASATLKVPAGASVTLICNEAAMFTISKPGNYAMAKFSDSCRVTSTNVSANYVKYVWAQMTKPSGSPGSNRKAYMNTVGAVSRSINNVWVDPRLDTVNYSGGVFPLSWKSYAEAKEFDFFLFYDTDMMNPFYSSTVTKLKIEIPSFLARMKPGKSYFWIAAVKGEENEERKVLNFVTKETYEQVLRNIKSQAGGVEAPAEEAYRIAFMLEDAHYLAEAYEYYVKAAQLDSANVLYRSTLMSFKKDYEIK
ncbi:MAG: hypothetical protein RJA57_149 [Bacteroidota bacterium]|jgi:hypothetical protein